MRYDGDRIILTIAYDFVGQRKTEDPKAGFAVVLDTQDSSKNIVRSMTGKLTKQRLQLNALMVGLQHAEKLLLKKIRVDMDSDYIAKNFSSLSLWSTHNWRGGQRGQGNIIQNQDEWKNIYDITQNLDVEMNLYPQQTNELSLATNLAKTVRFS